jgi:hypothetical protein
VDFTNIRVMGCEKNENTSLDGRMDQIEKRWALQSNDLPYYTRAILHVAINKNSKGELFGYSYQD